MSVQKGKVAIYVEVEPSVATILENLKNDLKLPKAAIVTFALQTLDEARKSKNKKTKKCKS